MTSKKKENAKKELASLEARRDALLAAFDVANTPPAEICKAYDLACKDEVRAYDAIFAAIMRKIAILRKEIAR